MVANFLKTFRILREHRVAVSHPQLSRSDSPGCPSWTKTPKFLWKNKRDLGLHRQWPPCPVPLPAAPLSPSHPTQRLSRTCTFQHNQMAVRICPLDLWLGDVSRNGKPRARPAGVLSRDIFKLTQPICLAFHCGLLFLPSIILFFFMHQNFPSFSTPFFLSRSVTNKQFFKNECNLISAFPACIWFMLMPKQVPVK